MRNAYEDADRHNWSKAELAAYDYVLMREQDERGRRSFADRKVFGKVVNKLVSLNVPMEEIAETIGLSVEAVRKIIDKK